MFEEGTKLTNFRLPHGLIEELDEARFALGKTTLAELVRDALRTYLEGNSAAIESWRRHRKKHGS